MFQICMQLIAYIWIVVLLAYWLSLASMGVALESISSAFHVSLCIDQKQNRQTVFMIRLKKLQDSFLLFVGPLDGPQFGY